jgi:WD40 repeat protein
MMMEIKPEVTNRVMTHSNPVVAAKFNKNSNQVVTLSQDGTMFFWLIESGQKIKTFNDLHGTSECTNLTFDESNTRIFTAGNSLVIFSGLTNPY